MRAESIKLRQRIDTTFIYVTHDQIEAMTLGDRIAIMKDGFVQQIGTPQEVFDYPANLFEAGFIGTPQMNFLNGRLEKTAFGYQIQSMEATVPVCDEMAAKLSAKDLGNADVTVGIRPEHITVQTEASNAIHVTVEVSELMGSEFYLHATVGQGDQKQNMVLHIQTPDLPPEFRSGVPFGTQIAFTFRNQLIHLFDPATEKNLLAD
jgi:multiple sugar transport system ATP-binding protein